MTEIDVNLAGKQVDFQNPAHISEAINEGLRALLEEYGGSKRRASDHCIERIRGLTDARLTSMKSNEPPGYTRDGAVLVSLVWVLLVDGLLVYRPQRARQWLFDILSATDLFSSEWTDTEISALIETFTRSVVFEDGFDEPSPEDITQTVSRLWLDNNTPPDSGNRLLPVHHRVFVGRERDVAALKVRLGIEDVAQRESLTIVRGWPGVGKTALINTLTLDEDVRDAFEEEVLWASIGPNGDVAAIFKSWARQLGAPHLLQAQSVQELRDGIRILLTGRDMLIVVDDIWTDKQAHFVRSAVDLTANTLLLTTRFTELANALADTPDDIYVLESLSEPHAIELLEQLAPLPVQLHRERMPELVTVVERLPLALRVAGPLLQQYHEMGFDINELLDEFEQDYNRLLQEKAPEDRFDEATGRTPTIELLFQRSVETLPEEGQEAFAALGVFREKPATFDFDAMESVWLADDPHYLVTIIVGRGLLDTTPDKRFRMHQTLHMYANKLLDEKYSDSI
jgi:hypothetical protein